MSDLFTVLIAEKEHIDAIQQDNKLFFEPFLENKELAFCPWDPAGQNLQDSAPGLLDIVGRHKQWRAVILNSCTPETLKAQNPFDAVDHSALDALTPPSRQPASDEAIGAWEAEWRAYYDALSAAKEATCKSALELPLQKLTTWLCFRPEDYILNEVQEKQDAHDWALEQIDKEDMKPSLRLELMEKAQYKNDLRMKENLRREFAAGKFLNVAHPAEVHCITIRTADNNFFDPDPYWNIRNESEYSAFADRNMYFDKMRFMVFDLLPRTHRNFRTDYIRFLASVLIFVSNPVPSSAMQARRLYRLESQTDDTPLCTMVTSYDRKLAATSEVIEAEMDKIRGEIPGELTDKAAESMFCTPKDVAVVLDASCEPEKVYAEKDYGLFFDRPENEFHKWNNSRNTSEKALSYIAKQRARSVRKSVNQTHAASQISDVNISRLTPFQIEDVRDYTNAAEDELVASIPPDLTDLSRYTKRLEQESENVKKVLARRMTQKTTFALGGFCLGLFLVCFLPFLFSNNGSPRTMTTAIVLIGGMLGLMAAIMLVTLIFLRMPLLDAVNGYNRTAKDVMNDILASLERASKYLSAFSNVRRGHAVQNYAEKNVDEYTKSLRIRRKHLEDIRKKRATLLEEYRDYFGDHSFCDEVMSRPYDYDFDLRTEFAYPAPFLAGDCRQIEFISSGNYVTVPSSYVTQILVRMEGIYEK